MTSWYRPASNLEAFRWLRHRHLRQACIIPWQRTRNFGTRRYAEGRDLKNETVLLVEDVVWIGGPDIGSAKIMRAN